MMAYIRLSASIAATLILASQSPAQPDYDFNWVTIGDPGNRDTTPDETPWEPDVPIGGVDHVFRISREPVAVEQWFDFVVAYAPFFDRDADNINARRYTSFWITHRTSDDTFHIAPGAERFPADMAWVYSARYVNWLHNAKVNEKWAFEDGAYDTSTFGWDDDEQNRTDQRDHHPDATFWIPTLDESTKANNWDPQKNDADGGYWLFPHSSNEVPIVGLPEDGGETNAGLEGDDRIPAFLDVGSYPNVQSPWGLLDGSGGEMQWTETAGIRGDRNHRGSSVWLGNPDIWDRIDFVGSSFPHLSTRGLRIASVPSPATLSVLGVSMVVLTRRRTRR